MAPPASAAPASSRASWAWLACVLLAALLLSAFRVADADTFWHLKTGQVILETGRLVRTNLFSAVHRDVPWHNMEWLFEVVLAAAYEAGGWAGVAALKIALVAATAALLFAALVTAAGAPWLAAVIGVLVLVLSRYRFTERPHLFSFLFFAFVIWALERDSRRGGRVLWSLPPLFALWSNMHPELVLSLGYLAARLVGEWIDAHREGGVARGALRRHLLLLLLCALATLANPAAYRVIASPLNLLQPAVGPQILEFERTTLARHPLFWLLAAAAALLIAARRGSRRWSDLLPLVFLGAVGAGYARATTAFAMAAAPLLHRGLAEWAGDPSPRVRRLLQAGAAAAVIGLVLGSLRLDQRLDYRRGIGPIPEMVPEAAASFILANDLPPVLYNHYNEGGYLIFRLYPRLGVFQDGRGAVPREFYQTLARQHSAGFTPLFEQFGVHTALVRVNELGRLFPASVWGLVYWDDVYAVLLRRSPATQPLLARLEYRAVTPGSGLPAGRELLERAVYEFRRNQRERAAPDWWLAIGTGVALWRLQDPAGAEREILRASEIAPAEPRAWAYLGWIRSRRGKREEAEAAIARARALDPTGAQIDKIIDPAGR